MSFLKIINKRNLAPISISVYTRLLHLKKCINYLKKNTLAKDSIAYIFSDGPRSGDEKKVKIIRSYIQSIKGFKEVILYQNKENNIFLNRHNAWSIPLNKHKKIIRIEDDIILSKNFLVIMNSFLDFYEKDFSIFGICGFTPDNLIPLDKFID